MSFAVDIETMPDLSMIDLLPEVYPSKALKDPVKIEADIRAKKQKQIDDMALNPMFAKIICIGMYSPDEQYALMGDEKTIIDDFWRIIGKDKLIVTYNGMNFDADVIIKRGLRYGGRNLTKDKYMLTSAYKGGRHIDIMNDFCQYHQYEKLDTLAKVYLGKQKIDIDFDRFPELMATEEGRQEIAKYCLMDCQLTYELAEKFGYNLGE